MLKRLIRRFLIVFLGGFVCLTMSNVHTKSTKVFALYLDKDFTRTEELAIYNAARLWERATNNMIKFVFKKTEVDFDPILFMSQNVIWRGSPKDGRLLIFETVVVGGEILGFAPPHKYIVLVPERTDSLLHFQKIAAHELGHHIGLLHTPAIMDSGSKSPCISKHDLIQFCDKYSCNLHEVRASCFDYIESN